MNRRSALFRVVAVIFGVLASPFIATASAYSTEHSPQEYPELKNENLGNKTIRHPIEFVVRTQGEFDWLRLHASYFLSPTFSFDPHKEMLAGVHFGERNMVCASYDERLVRTNGSSEPTLDYFEFHDWPHTGCLAVYVRGYPHFLVKIPRATNVRIRYWDRADEFLAQYLIEEGYSKSLADSVWMSWRPTHIPEPRPFDPVARHEAYMILAKDRRPEIHRLAFRALCELLPEWQGGQEVFIEFLRSPAPLCVQGVPVVGELDECIKDEELLRQGRKYLVEAGILKPHPSAESPSSDPDTSN